MPLQYDNVYCELPPTFETESETNRLAENYSLLIKFLRLRKEDFGWAKLYFHDENLYIEIVSKSKKYAVRRVFAVFELLDIVDPFGILLVVNKMLTQLNEAEKKE
jgi:hypothetical protein